MPGKLVDGTKRSAVPSATIQFSNGNGTMSYDPSDGSGDVSKAAGSPLVDEDGRIDYEKPSRCSLQT
jgi:hypothetical protein